MKEIVLPSGRFATMREMKWWDWIVTATATSFDMRVMLAACRIVTIDGKPLTLDQAMELSMSESGPIIAAVCQELAAGLVPKEASDAAAVRPTIQ